MPRRRVDPAGLVREVWREVVNEPTKKNPDQTQVGGDHYKKMKIQPTEYIIANGLNFCEGNVVKYVSRHRTKGGAEDLRKAIHYLELLLKHEYNGA